MNIGVILMLALAPAVFWLWYFYRKDRFEPEPRGLILRTHLWGVFFALPAAAVEMIIPAGVVVSLVIVAPVVEELAKFLAVYWTVFRKAEFDEPMDGIVYAAAAALGFAAIENVGYVLGTHIEHGASAALQVSLVRGVLSVPGHVLFSVMWGFALGMAYRRKRAFLLPLLLPGLLLSMAFHSAFNLVLLLKESASLLMLALVYVLWKMTGTRIEQSLARSPFRAEEDEADSQ